jgi:alpha-D-ribose 1-methylphosphonate 5-triphosphate diphosphatase PhnM
MKLYKNTPTKRKKRTREDFMMILRRRKNEKKKEEETKSRVGGRCSRMQIVALSCSDVTVNNGNFSSQHGHEEKGIYRAAPALFIGVTFVSQDPLR